MKLWPFGRLTWRKLKNEWSNTLTHTGSTYPSGRVTGYMSSSIFTDNHLWRIDSIRDCRNVSLSIQITEKLGPRAYKLKLCLTSKIHLGFHISLLKPHRGDICQDLNPFPQISIRNHPILRPAAIIDYKTLDEDFEHNQKVLVHWSGLPVEELSGKI